MLNKNKLNPKDAFMGSDSLSNFEKTKTTKKPSLSILGLGYVGAVSTACFSDRGHRVIGVDPNEEKVSTLNLGQSPIVEAGLGDLLFKGINNGSLIAISDTVEAVKQTDITLVSVGTPTGSDGVCQLDYLKVASEQIGEALRSKDGYHLIVYRSTVPPKTTCDVMIPILEKSSGKQSGKDFGVCFNPEFLRESTAIEDFYAPPKTVIGAIDQRSSDYAATLYEGIEGEMIHTSIEAAEFVKYIDNTWHALKVTFGNEVGRLCQSMDVDGHTVMDIFVKDTKLNLSPYYLKPGFAFGGSCLPKDTRGITHLAEQQGIDIPLINNIIASNDQHIAHALKLIKKANVNRVGIVGLTFKADTDDLRESPSVELMQQLHDGGHEVSYYDPNVNPERLLLAGMSTDLSHSQCRDILVLIRTTDLLVITHKSAYAQKIAKVAKQHIPVIDLVGLDDDFKGTDNYQGICW
jgi:GDP-mannose 6-dehydrogenase